MKTTPFLSFPPPPHATYTHIYTHKNELKYDISCAHVSVVCVCLGEEQSAIGGGGGMKSLYQKFIKFKKEEVYNQSLI